MKQLKYDCRAKTGFYEVQHDQKVYICVSFNKLKNTFNVLKDRLTTNKRLSPSL